MARRFAEIRQLEHDVSKVQAMERCRCLGGAVSHTGRGHGRQRQLQHRQHRGSRPCLGSGRKRGTLRRGLGRSRGGFTSKLHCLAEGQGRPLAFPPTVGEAADCRAYDALIALPEQTPKGAPSRQALPELVDGGYDADAIRADLGERGIKAVVPGRSNRRVRIEHDRGLYKQRNHIERFFGRLKINRAFATRYDRLAESFLSMVHIATARYWLKFVHAA
mgnify:CR=1 FL=1